MIPKRAKKGNRKWDSVKPKAMRLLADPDATYTEVSKATGVPEATLKRWSFEARNAE